MARGRQPSPIQQLEERVIEDIAVAHELVAHDRYELATYEVLDQSLGQVLGHLARGHVAAAIDDVQSCRRALTELRRRDLAENRRHRTIAQPIAAPSAGLSVVAS